MSESNDNGCNTALVTETMLSGSAEMLRALHWHGISNPWWTETPHACLYANALKKSPEST
jgi:hypothetical protein